MPVLYKKWHIWTQNTKRYREWQEWFCKKYTEWVTIKRFLLKYNLVTDLFLISINDVTRTQTTADIVTSSSSYPRTVLQTVQFRRTSFMDKSSLHFPQHVYQRCVLALL